MRSYGHDRRDKLTCKYGCCQLKKGVDIDACNKRAKKRGRADGKADVEESLTALGFDKYE